MKYTVVFHRTEEGISVSVPGLPGCWSEGDTDEEALLDERAEMPKCLSRSCYANVSTDEDRTLRHAARHARRFSYTDSLTWDGRWELIDGEPFAMAPAPTIRHQIILQNLWTVIVQHFRGKPCRPFVVPTDVKLSEQDVVEPDLLVVCEPSKIGEAAILGAPDLVIEVTSPSTEARDRREKRDLYERFQAPEYWIVSPSGFIERYALDEGGRYEPPTGQRGLRGGGGRVAAAAGAAGGLASVGATQCRFVLRAEITVLYTDRDDDERRIISAWRSEPHERRYYWQNIEP